MIFLFRPFKACFFLNIQPNFSLFLAQKVQGGKGQSLVHNWTSFRQPTFLTSRPRRVYTKGSGVKLRRSSAPSKSLSTPQPTSTSPSTNAVHNATHHKVTETGHCSPVIQPEQIWVNYDTTCNPFKLVSTAETTEPSFPEERTIFNAMNKYFN